MIMTSKCNAVPGFTQAELVAHALGQYNAEIELHLQYCPSCCDEVELFRSILRSTQQVFNGEVTVAHLVPCKHRVQADSLECLTDDPMGSLQIVMRPEDGQLQGRVVCENDPCSCLIDAPIRLFGSHGYVESAQVDAEGNFSFSYPDAVQRYSLGLVVNHQEDAELQIIGDFELPV